MPIEKSVSIGEGEDALFGTLMLPDGKNRFDAVLIWSGLVLLTVTAIYRVTKTTVLRW
jgi:hypothetical protein